MKAYLLQEPRTLRIEEREVGPLAATDVLVRIANVGLCGSDIHLFRGSYNGPHSYPMLFGHEWSGTVEKVGSAVTDFAPGDKVTGDCSRYCGTCDYCEDDKNLCAHIEKFGITIDGASAEHIVRDQRYLYKAAPDVDLTLLALSEPIAVARHLIRRVMRLTGNLAGKKILVYGGGVIGQAALVLLKLDFGAASVDLFDLVASRTALAAKLGAHIPSADDLKVTDGADYATLYQQARYDVILETTGVGPVFANALGLLRPGGTLGSVGMIAKVEIPQKLIVTKALNIVGSIGGTGEFEEVIPFIARHADTVRHLVSHRFAMADAEEAFAVAIDAGHAMKVVLQV